MRNFIHNINRIMAELSGVSLGFIMGFILIDVISRIMYRPLMGVVEMAVFCMLISVYLGLSYCEEKKAHVRVEALLSHLPHKYVRTLNLVSYFLTFLMSGILVYVMWKYALYTYKTKEAMSGVDPMVIYPVVFVMFVSCVFFCIQVFFNFLETFREFNKKS